MTMNKKERILRAIQGKQVDRVPVCFYTHLPLEDNAVPANIRWAKDSGMDLLAIEPDGFYGLLWDRPLRTLEDFKQLRPYKKDDLFIAAQVDRARRIADALRDDASVYYMLFTPFSFVKHTINEGQTAVMELWNEDMEAFKQVMDVIEEDNCLLMDELHEKADLDGFFISMQSGEKWRFAPEEYREHLTPYDKRLIDYADTKYGNNIIHLCSWGNEPNNVELWRDYNYKVLNWGVYQEENLSMLQGRSYFKPGTTVMGGFDRLPEGILYRGTEKEIKDFTKNLIRETGDIGFIISADCSVQEDTPIEHLSWVVEAAEEYAGLR